jgi:hypothetical protein
MILEPGRLYDAPGFLLFIIYTLLDKWFVMFQNTLIPKTIVSPACEIMGISRGFGTTVRRSNMKFLEFTEKYGLAGLLNPSKNGFSTFYPVAPDTIIIVQATSKDVIVKLAGVEPDAQLLFIEGLYKEAEEGEGLANLTETPAGKPLKATLVKRAGKHPILHIS